MLIYHGSDHKLIKPQYGFGKSDNDYGSGFYCTCDYQKAAEWAINNGNEGSYVNIYEIDETDLNIVHLDEYGTLSWIAEIICNRGARGEDAAILGEKLVVNYKIDLSDADIVIGYRADDSYSDIVDAFLKNQINIDEVDRLFRKGNLGEQYFIKSKKAFDKIAFVKADTVNEKDYSNQEEFSARVEVSRFLRNRNSSILVNGFIPYGITAKEAADNYYVYNPQHNYYEICEKEEPDKGDDRDDI